MNEERAKRLEKKYENSASQSGPVRQLNVTGRTNRAASMMAHGKPKNTGATVKRLSACLGQDRILLAAAAVVCVLYTLTALASSYLLRPLINRFIYFDGTDPAERIIGLGRGLLVLAALYLISVVCQWLQGRIMLSVSQRSLQRLRRDLFDHLQKLPVSYFDGHSTGDIMSRFANDVDAVGEMLNTTLVQMLSGAITIAGNVFLMLYTNVLLGLISIVLTPLLTLISRQIMKQGKKAYSEQQRRLGALNGFAQETISGQKVVKVFRHEEIAEDEFEYLNRALMRAQIRAQFRSGIMGPVTHQLCNLGYALTACVGALLVVKRGFDIGGLTVSVNYTRQFNRPINEIATQMNNVFSALAGAERVFELMDLEPEGAGETAARENGRTAENVCTEESPSAGTGEALRGHIVLEHVSFGYVPGVPALHDISLTAEPGQKIAFVGSTGAGKTTVTNLLSRFYEIEAGRILMDGVPIERIDRPFLRRNIAMVLQDTHLFTGTVRENIRYGRLDATDAEVEEAARVASAHDFILHLENGYDTVLEHDGANLSQGQRQLLNIARAAVSGAPILVLDEATSSVDTRTERHIEAGMDAIMKNRTTFVIAHRLSTVRQADIILVLEHGRILERGTHEELLEKGGRYADLYHEILELE